MTLVFLKIGMRKFIKKTAYFIICICFLTIHANAQHRVTFCGEPIPVSNKFVAEKLMDIIKRMRSIANMPSIRASANAYFPYIESQLIAHGLPVDFKYLPIVESNFQLLVSKAGARGFWQFMPATARDYGLRVDDVIDEREDIEKSTIAACRLIRDYYKYIFRTHKFYSWALTAAAYNFGNGNISKAIRAQGTNYYTMSLNPETAQYVYKIIAVKELFENPELYMKNFGYNIFNPEEVKERFEKTVVEPKEEAEKEKEKEVEVEVIDEAFEALEITAQTEETPVTIVQPDISFLKAVIVGNYQPFKDGSIVEIKILENLIADGSYRRKESLIRGKGYLIDDRVYVDLGFEHIVQLYDAKLVKGIPVIDLKNKGNVLLRVESYD
jgi:membrane-bound lytic murein transglycosylase D